MRLGKWCVMSESDSSIKVIKYPCILKSQYHQNVARIEELAPEELQCYVHAPPGKGKAILYVAVNLLDGKMYVGKHAHGKGGRSMWASRGKAHCQPRAEKRSYFANAMRLHGSCSFGWLIVWHGDECEVDKTEKHWISPEGLHTIADNGGWGYNLMEGGEGASHRAKSTLLKLSVNAKAQMDREADAGMVPLHERAALWWQTATPEQRLDHKNKCKAVYSDERKKKYAEARRMWHETVSEDVIKLRSERQSDTCRAKFEESIKHLPLKQQEQRRRRRAKSDRLYERFMLRKEAVRSITNNPKLTNRQVAALIQEGVLRGSVHAYDGSSSE